MQEAFTIRDAIMGLFKDQKVEASFFDFLNFFKDFSGETIRTFCSLWQSI